MHRERRKRSVKYGKTRQLLRRVASRIEDMVHRSSLPPPLAEIALRVRDERLTYLPFAKLDKIGGLALFMEEKAVSSVFLKAGCAFGGRRSCWRLQSAAKGRSWYTTFLT